MLLRRTQMYFIFCALCASTSDATHRPPVNRSWQQRRHKHSHRAGADVAGTAGKTGLVLFNRQEANVGADEHDAVMTDSVAVMEDHGADARGRHGAKRKHGVKAKGRFYDILRLDRAPVSASTDCYRDPMEGSFTGAMYVALMCLCGVACLIAFLVKQKRTADRTGAVAETSSRGQLPANESLPQLQKRPNLDALDGCRTVMIMYVLLYHIHFDGVLPPGITRLVLNARWLMQFFFVLSGFIMTYASQGSVDTFDRASGSLYIGRRLVRLLPSYYFAAFFALVLGFAGDIRPSALRPYGAWPVHVLCLQALWPVQICPPVNMDFQETEVLSLTINGPAWFTSAIVFLSIAFPFLYNKLPRGDLQTVVAVLVVTILVRSIPTAMSDSLPTFSGLKYYTFVLMRVPEFFAGMLSAQICSLLPGQVMQQPIWGSIFDATLSFSFLLSYAMGPWEGITNDGDYFLTGLFCLTMISARCAVVRPDGAKGSSMPASGLLGVILASPVLTRMSEFSFGAYILQFQVYRVFHLKWWPFRLAKGCWPIYIACIWVSAWVVTRCVDDPIRRAVDRWSRDVVA
jgi:peptidoglycan/LPS O-acetylase OafA/YrhL|eukprot:TRINITY_DN55837_c0_g1_i1.p1 TRINITY_DN55837_c0_g1~~TRINITY_DN55837_c0_g1_i1.p1  ORF type:complete len:572 (+),score=40.14 TRINITY_DN55837_c0_g1_i1:121-1836(+)